MDRNEREAVCEELAAQLARCRARGLNPQHADTHHHVHEEWGILPVVMEVCRAEGIRWLRLARNMGRSTGMVRTVYRRWVNRRIRAWGLARTRYFGSWMDYRHALSHGQLADGDIEIMVHPRWNESGVLVDGTCGLPLERLREDAVARQ
jgi:predicted glycoside hydrolase/deacetylase ChbG (UPF0249 family)